MALCVARIHPNRIFSELQCPIKVVQGYVAASRNRQGVSVERIELQNSLRELHGVLSGSDEIIHPKIPYHQKMDIGQHLESHQLVGIFLQNFGSNVFGGENSVLGSALKMTARNKCFLP